MQLETGALTSMSLPTRLQTTRACWFHYKLSSCWFGTVFFFFLFSFVFGEEPCWRSERCDQVLNLSGMGLNCMLEKKEKNTMYKKKLHFQMFGVFLFCYLDGHLSCCASCPFFKKGNLKRVLRRAFLFFFFFFLQRWSVCLFFFLQERITGLHFPFSFFCFSTQTKA